MPAAFVYNQDIVEPKVVKAKKPRRKRLIKTSIYHETNNEHLESVEGEEQDETEI